MKAFPWLSLPGRPLPLPLAGALLLAACLLLGPGCASLPSPPGEPETPPPPTRPRIGLALGGGGARGFAEIGVIRVLEQEKIPVDLVVGTSVGSLIGALYADTGKVLDLEFTAIGLTEEDIFDSAIFNLPSGGLVKGARLEEFLRRHLRHQKIQEMAIPFAAVAVELWSGRTAVFKTGDVVPAVHASCAIPGIFVPFTYGERVYVDGGVTNPVPASEARKLGADLVIAVAIPPNIRRQETKSPLAIVHQAITVMAAEIGRLRAQEADVVITPEVGDVFFNDFSRKKELIEAGEAAARAAMPAIRAALAARTRAMASQP